MRLDTSHVVRTRHLLSVPVSSCRATASVIEARLERSEALLAQAQRLTRTGSLWWQTSTGEITWSEQTYRLMEYALTVKPTMDLVVNRCHPDDLALLQEKLTSAIRDGADMDFEHRLLMPNGAVKHVRVFLQNVGFESGAPEFMGAVTDITEWKQAEEKQRRSEEALGMLRSEIAHAARVTSLGILTASIAHEVNQPLSGIVTNASTCLRMLASEPPNIGGAREAARRALRDGNRASEVIVRLRALFSRQPPLAEPVDLNDATREVMALTRSELQRGRAVVRLELADDLPLVVGDRVQLQQVIINLLRNASEATSGIDDRPREIVITTARADDDVYLSVFDSGVGFEPRCAEKVFDAFYTTKHYGIGIGLSVSRSIIENHRGRLWAVPNDGAGATFSFAIPYASDGSGMPVQTVQ